jgi:predicted metal-binding membrane protein
MYERVLVFVLLAIITAASWGVMVSMAQHMARDSASPLAALGPGMVLFDTLSAAAPGQHHQPHEGFQTFQPLHSAGVVTMWLVMVAGMMLPTAIPTILAYSDITEAGRTKGEATGSVFFFVAGYLAVWAITAVGGAWLQEQLHHYALLTPVMISHSLVLSASVLLLAGLYQFSPLKDACLSACRSPLQFFLTNWRDGHTGALSMGLQHGGVCVGCCWALMAVMYVVGVMNVVCMALLGILMLSEKVWSHGHLIRRVSGIGAMLWSLMLLLST